VVREFERDGGDEIWLVLDARGTVETAEAAIEVAAALAARLTVAGIRWGFAAGTERLAPGAGPARLDAVLDRLAAHPEGPLAPPTAVPAVPGECILVTTRPAGDVGWLEVFVVDGP
jgi:uncharacterized protein (DUF58 family)